MNEQLRDLTHTLNRLFITHRKCYLQESQIYGLYVGQPQILNYVRNNPGCTQKEIADEIGVSSASIAFSTKRLETSGLLMRQVNSLDMRCNKLYITSEGIMALDRFEESYDKLNETMFDGFSEADLQELESFAERVSANLERMGQRSLTQTSGSE